MVNQETFEFHLRRLEGVFGKRHFSEERVRMIWEVCHPVEPPDFVTTVNQIISSMRKPPMPQDFAEALRGKRRYVTESSGAEIRACAACGDVGVLRATESSEDVDTLVLCLCAEGKKQIWALPELSTRLRQMLKITTLPVEWFKPKAPVPLTSSHPQIRQWKIRIKEAEMYWQKWAEALGVPVPKPRRMKDPTEVIGW